MEKRKWPWKKKSSERSSGDSDGSGSFSSHSERYSDEQEVLLEVTSKALLMDDEVKETIKSLTEKLSAALVNVSAKQDLVKQHAKVAEEAVAGWEKAENEAAALKQQLEAAMQQNISLEVRASHLHGALKECVRQLRQSKDEQEKLISSALLAKTIEWEAEKAELEKQILNLLAENKNSESVDPNTLLILETLERENLSLKQEFVSHFKEFEIITIERDLSTRAAENASKLQLESIKKITKLEAECRRLQCVARKSTPLSNNKSFGVSSFYAESLTDSCKSSNTEANGSELNWSELDQFKNEKHSPKNLATEIDMMDDFLEMERLAALSEESVFVDNDNNPPRTELDLMARRVDELENELKKIEREKLELENVLDESLDSLKAARSKMAESETRLGEMENEVKAVNETKELLEFQLVGMEVEARTLSASIESLKADIEEERKLSEGLSVKCQELENELTRKIQEPELEKGINSNVEPKIKQEDLAVAADKLAECQKTIASLGRQLESLATLEDFLIDTSNIPGFSKVSATGRDIWRLPCKNTSLSKCDSDRSRMSMVVNHGHLANGDEDTLQTSSTNHVPAAKSRNGGLGKYFSRSKSVIELGNSQD